MREESDSEIRNCLKVYYEFDSKGIPEFEKIKSEIDSFEKKYSFEREYPHVRKIVDKKLSHIIQNDISDNSLDKWETFLSKIEIPPHLKLYNLNFLQFPSLIMEINEEVENSKFKERKSFFIIASLLGPFYTYHYEYLCWIKNSPYNLPISQKRFLEDKRHQILKPNLKIQEIVNNFNKIFQKYEYVYHYYASINKIPWIIPYGSFRHFSVDLQASYYELVFNSAEKDRLEILT